MKPSIDIVVMSPKNLFFFCILGKGVYVKSNPLCDPSDPSKSAIIEDITYENIKMNKPEWWAIWIGPQQQHEPNTPLGKPLSATNSKILFSFFFFLRIRASHIESESLMSEVAKL